MPKVQCMLAVRSGADQPDAADGWKLSKCVPDNSIPNLSKNAICNKELEPKN